jgi:hypothetical protein
LLLLVERARRDSPHKTIDVNTMTSQEDHHWLDNYSNNKHPWHLSTSSNGSQSFTRPLGLVETSFDTDGTYFGGRADMTATLTLRTKHTLSKASLRQRIALSWTLLRLHHSLLSARIEDDPATGKHSFVVDIPRSPEHAVQDVGK